MVPHQRQSPRPVEVRRHDVADLGPAALVGLELVDDVTTGLPGGPDRPRSAVRRPQDRAPVGGLAAAARVEDRAVEDDQRTAIRSVAPGAASTTRTTASSDRT